MEIEKKVWKVKKRIAKTRQETKYLKKKLRK